MLRGLFALSLLWPAARAVAGNAAPKTVPPSILLITLDTTRQDAIDCYRDPVHPATVLEISGGQPPVTPALDALCARGRRFTRAYTPAPITLAAHAALLTGRYPTRNGVHDNGIFVLSPDIPTLAQSLKRQGYGTAAAISSVVLDRHYGLDRGFGSYDDRLAPGGGKHQLLLERREAARTVDAALRLIAVLPAGRPWFFWLHLYDPHNDYAAPEPYRSRHSPYLATVAYMDHELGRLFAALESAGRLKRTLVVVAGDHGESLGQHGEKTHGVFLYDTTLRVPLLAAGPGVEPGADDTPVSLVDVMPALLQAAGAPRPAGLDGTALPFTGSVAVPGRRLYAEAELGMNSFHWAPLHAAIGLAGGNLVKTIQAPEPEHYDLAADPAEEKNLFAGLAPARQRGLLDAVAALRAGARRAHTLDAAPETRRALQRLGYLSGAAAADDDLPRPDPKRVIGLLDIFDRARSLAENGKCAAAAPLLLDILRQNPGNVPVIAQLGWCRLELKEPSVALALYAQAVKLSPAMEPLHYQLGNSLLQTGDRGGAQREWRAALALNPRYPAAIAGLMRLEREDGHPAAAAGLYRTAVKDGVEDAPMEAEAGMLAVQRADFPAAERAFRRALRLDPRHVAARANLARILFARKDAAGALQLYEQGIDLLPGEPEFLLPAASLILNGCPETGDCPRAAAAVRHFEAFLSAHPDAPNAEHVRGLLRKLSDGNH